MNGRYLFFSRIPTHIDANCKTTITIRNRSISPDVTVAENSKSSKVKNDMMVNQATVLPRYRDKKKEDYGSSKKI